MASETVAGSHRNVRPEAVLLDAAGTLIAPSEPVGETYARVAKGYGAELQVDKLTRAFAGVLRGMPDLAFQWTSTAELQRLERDWWRTLVRRVVAHTGTSMGAFDDYFEALYRHYAGGAAWECFPDVPRVLEALRARGYRLAVVSNFDSRLPGILQALGIHRLLDAVVFSSEAGSAKPDPHIFRRALVKLDAEPQCAIHVGDSEKADVGGAVAAGLTALLIERNGPTAARSGHVIGTLDELLPRLEGPAARRPSG